MTVGNAKYQCSCVDYILQGNITLIVSLTVGIGLPLIILIVIIAIFVYHRRQRKPAKRTDMSKYDTPMDRYEILDKTYNRQQPADYKTVTFLDDEDGNNRRLPGVEGNQYSTGLPEEWNEYSSQLPPNEDNDYSRGLPEDEPSEYTYSRGLPDD